MPPTATATQVASQWTTGAVAQPSTIKKGKTELYLKNEQALEDYLLDKAQTTMKRLTVFTGPVYRDDDPLYGKTRPNGPWKIPLSYWKVAVLQKTPAKVAAAAFIVGQVQYVQALFEAKVFTRLTPYTVDEMRQRHIQTTIQAIADVSGLDFSAVLPFDAQGSLEATRQTRWISDINDVVI